MLDPTHSELSRSRDLFRHLLDRTTTEREWQHFFTDHPFVLSRSLPLRLEPADILPLGRPGRAEPDFAFYPRGIHPIPYYGVIELKRADSPIVSTPRSNIAILSRDAETAVQQALAYSRQPCSFLPRELDERPLILGNRAHLFVVMGMSSEIVSKVGLDLYRETVERTLPGNLQLLPYDTLLHMYESGLPPKVHFLVANPPEEKQVVQDAPIEFDDRDDCMLDEHGHCTNQMHWGANE